MSTNSYFNNFSASVINEQRLLEDLIVESIQIYGADVKYMPRETYDSLDSLYGEDPESKFTRAYNVEMYLANVEGYEGDGDFFSKFGLEIRDTSNFVVSRRAFERYIPSTIARRPREGDLIFVPVLNKIFEIKFVEEELMFFSLGKRTPYMYELRCEVFRYSQEDFATGDEEIDILERSFAYTIELTLGNGANNYIAGETVYQGANLESSTVSAEVKDWNPMTKKLQVINIDGAFTNSTSIKGEQSNASYNLVSSDGTTDFVDSDEFDNKILQTEADEFIDISESNPFGAP